MRIAFRKSMRESSWNAHGVAWQAAGMQGFLSALADLALAFAAWWAPVVYFIGASWVTVIVAGDNERARNWMIGLFMAVFVLAVVLIFGWPHSAD